MCIEPRAERLPLDWSPGADQDDGCRGWEELPVYTWESFFRNLSLGGARVGKEKFGSCDDVVARCFAQIILVAVFREWET